ncbi:hypothetical protein FVE85_3599 [Porphyridium purpureum]|uniref:Uncharacterized protein n=1 Tax=Porphyridium purpureum TaxID=35688 RepID=A0A5J4YL08_PORPP|nr:hypothetical protein FVE85_3599 [Porphyridium purpureum]|eukprot:POR3610..scf249_10
MQARQRNVVASLYRALNSARWIHACGMVPKMDFFPDPKRKKQPMTHAKSDAEADGPDGAQDGKSPEFPDPFYVIWNGEDAFRGIIYRRYAEYVALGGTLSLRYIRHSKMITWDGAFAFLRYKYVHHGKGENLRFFAFRNGKNGTRGYTVSMHIFRAALRQADAPQLEKRAFRTTTQALVFCQQAGTEGTDWQTLEGSVRFMAKHPAFCTPKLVSEFLIRATVRDSADDATRRQKQTHRPTSGRDRPRTLGRCRDCRILPCGAPEFRQSVRIIYTCSRPAAPTVKVVLIP